MVLQLRKHCRCNWRNKGVGYSKNIKTSLISWLGRVLDEAILPHFTIHSLRHTNITLQIAAEVSLITVAGRAGHSRTSIATDSISDFGFEIESVI